MLLFFGRVHVKKGLDLLAEALGRTVPDHPDLHLLVAGNDDGAWVPFRDRMAELGPDRPDDLSGACRRRAGAAGLGGGRRVCPSQL